LHSLGIDMRDNSIQEVQDPVLEQDAANKQYVDSQVANMNNLNTQVLDNLADPIQIHDRGRKDVWTSGALVPNGSVVVIDFGTPNIRAVVCEAVPEPNSAGVLGISLNYAEAESKLEVMKSGGLCTVNVTEYPPQDIQLDNSNTGDIQTQGSYNFTDSGGVPGEYKSNEQYEMVFRGSQTNETWTLEFSGWEFEQSAQQMYDRFGIQVSENGNNWSNAAIPWMYRSTELNAPWSVTKDAPATGGWIFPPTPAQATAEGWDGGDLVLTSRYIKFVFFSDDSVTRIGWQILVTSGNGVVISPGDALYVDATSPSSLAKVGTFLVGSAASPMNAAGAALVILN
jgi:hypothetical protein